MEKKLFNLTAIAGMLINQFGPAKLPGRNKVDERPTHPPVVLPMDNINMNPQDLPESVAEVVPESFNFEPNFFAQDEVKKAPSYYATIQEPQTTSPGTLENDEVLFNGNLNTPLLPFGEFVGLVKKENYTGLRGFYAPGLFSAGIRRQDNADASQVRTGRVFTEYSASMDGVKVLLTHFSGAGSEVNMLTIGSIFYTVTTSGHIEEFIVDEISIFEAKSPMSVFSYFIDEEGKELTNVDVFMRFYTKRWDTPKNQKRGKVVLQTCTDNASTGRRFVVARQVELDKKITSIINGEVDVKDPKTNDLVPVDVKTPITD